MVFAGGGNRCWWQAGWWDTVAPELGLRPRVITGISAGAATACMVYTHDSREVMAYYRKVLAGNRRNAYWGNLLNRQRVCPALRDLPHRAAEHLRRRPPGALAGGAGNPHRRGPYPALERSAAGGSRLAWWPTTSRSTGSRRCTRGWAASWASIRSSCARRTAARPSNWPTCCCNLPRTPPFTPVLRRDGRPVLDGGMVDNVPVDALDATPGDVLVLVTRLYPRPRRFVLQHGAQRRLYLQPSQRVPISSWDYTQPGAMTGAYDLGRRDGETFLREWPSVLKTELGNRRVAFNQRDGRPSGSVITMCNAAFAPQQEEH
ncbi:patatin-like phospholipase family protein [Cupriavidus basilensis]